MPPRRFVVKLYVLAVLFLTVDLALMLLALAVGMMRAGGLL